MHNTMKGTNNETEPIHKEEQTIQGDGKVCKRPLTGWVVLSYKPYTGDQGHKGSLSALMPPQHVGSEELSDWPLT